MLGKFTKMNFDFICKISLEFSKMGITFAYELGLKSFLYEKSSTRKVIPKRGIFQMKKAELTCSRANRNLNFIFLTNTDDFFYICVQCFHGQSTCLVGGKPKEANPDSSVQT